MKTERATAGLVMGFVIAVAPLGTALAGRDHDSHDRGRREVEHRHYHGGGRHYPYYGWYRPWYRPAVSFTYVRTPRYYSYDDYGTVYRGRSIEAEVQIALAKRGYYRGPVDGDIGPGSRAAIRAYQVDRGLRVTGRIDNALLRSLRL